MTDQHELILLGAGGAGIEALMVAQRMATWSVLGFADDGKRENVDGLAVLGGIDEVIDRFSGRRMHFHCAVGDNRDRERIAELAESRGLVPASLVDPSAYVAPSVTIGAGAYVAPFSFVGPQARVGRHVLLNVGVSVGHHSDLADYCQLCPGARVSGKASLGTGAFVGSNGVVAPGIRMGEWSSLGAASLAARDVPPGFSAVGVPARMMGSPGQRPKDDL